MMQRRISILNGRFDPLTLDGTVEAIMELMRQGRRGWVCTVNVAILMMMRADPRLQEFIDRAAIVVADGQPLVWLAPLLDRRLPERVTGVDLVDVLCERACRQGVGVYLLGATDEVVGRVAERLLDGHPGLCLAFGNGYFSEAEAIDRVDAIRATNASILLVGMGVPRQERFIEEHWDRLGVSVALGVGGSFDVLAGLRHRAPPWVQRIGMEWLYRLIQEPRRLMRRYLVTNTEFLYLVFRALLGRLRGSPAGS